MQTEQQNPHGNEAQHEGQALKVHPPIRFQTSEDPPSHMGSCFAEDLDANQGFCFFGLKKLFIIFSF